MLLDEGAPGSQPWPSWSPVFEPPLDIVSLRLFDRTVRTSGSTMNLLAHVIADGAGQTTHGRDAGDWRSGVWRTCCFRPLTRHASCVSQDMAESYKWGMQGEELIKLCGCSSTPTSTLRVTGNYLWIKWRRSCSWKTMQKSTRWVTSWHRVSTDSPGCMSSVVFKRSTCGHQSFNTV